ncbi:MAG: Agmatinase [Candidatus Eremiobacteraeota bacterium]|nr:Agmatinase [Candidatus Eremiobacteraeota bacterium]
MSESGGADSLKRARFAHVPTIFGLPDGVRDDTDVALIGVPFDGGVTHRPGARHGPEAIRAASKLIRRVHHRSRIAPFEVLRCADAGDVPIEHWFDLSAAHGDIERFYGSLPHGTIPLSLGGDHSITIPILRALGRERPVAVVHVDAHCDTSGEYGGSLFHHGAPFRIAAQEGLIVPELTFQLGIRGSLANAEQWSYSYESGMTVVTIEDLYERGIAAVGQSVAAALGDTPVYVSFDVDAVDPVYAPGTGTPEIGGLTSLDALILIRSLAGANCIGADIVEVSPPFDLGGHTSLLAATLAFEILCVIAARERRL